jgi:hypothetical protein
MAAIDSPLARIAADRTRRFEGLNAASRSGTVHAVAPVETLGQSWPGTACHTGVYGGEATGLEPTTEAVTCRLCQRITGFEPADDLFEPPPTLF